MGEAEDNYYEDIQRTGRKIAAALGNVTSAVALGALSIVVVSVYEETGDDIGKFDAVLRVVKEAVKQRRGGQ